MWVQDPPTRYLGELGFSFFNDGSAAASGTVDVSDLPGDVQGALVTIATSYSQMGGDFTYNFNRLVNDYRNGDPATVNQVATYATATYPSFNPGGAGPDNAPAPTLSQTPECQNATWGSGLWIYCKTHGDEIAAGQLSKEQVVALSKSTPSTVPGDEIFKAGGGGWGDTFAGQLAWITKYLPTILAVGAIGYFVVMSGALEKGVRAARAR